MISFDIISTTALAIQRPTGWSDAYVLSPYLWADGDRYQALLRIVNRSDDPYQKVARIFHATSDDGIHLTTDQQPSLRLGPDADDFDGTEDPSLTRDGGQFQVFYSGWNQSQKQTQLLRAVGTDIDRLEKRGRVFTAQGQYENPKEAEIVRCPSGKWMLFFEYANEGRSKIGLASAGSLDGPWEFLPDPFVARPDSFDAWHLSPGPIVRAADGQQIMLYNGATQDAHWRIGWVALNEDLTAATARCAEPVIVPPPPSGDATDIAFAASAIQSDTTVLLYYSVSDAQSMCAELRLSV